MGAKRFVSVLALPAAVVLTLVSDSPAGGIADEPCPNVAGEHTNTCPPSKVGTPYSIRFVETEGSGCGPGKQTFHFDSGLLPPGLTLAADGTLSGVPTQVGTFRFYVEMREPQNEPASCAGKRTQKQFTLKVCRQLSIVPTPAFPARAEVRVPLELRLSYCGAMGVLVWSVSAGELPAGVTLGADGSMFGAPRVAGTYRFTATATDTLLRSVSFTRTLAVAARLVVQARRLPPARVGRRYRGRLAASGGIAPRVWRVARGSLPGGIRLVSAQGVLTGTPKKAGTHRFTVEVKDDLGVTSTRTLTIVVRAPPSTASSK
jgi:large repetitive protein